MRAVIRTVLVPVEQRKAFEVPEAAAPKAHARVRHDVMSDMNRRGAAKGQQRLDHPDGRRPIASASQSTSSIARSIGKSFFIVDAPALRCFLLGS